MNSLTRRSAGAFVLVLSSMVGAPAGAQDLGLFAQGGYFSMKAADSARAVFDSPGGATFGGGASYGFLKHFYAEAAFRTFSKDGERVFVSAPGAQVYKLGHPLSARIRSIYGTVGYRLSLGRSAFVPYVGVGAGTSSYHEESTVAGIVETQDQSKASFHGLVGLEYGKGHFRFAAEGAITSVPSTIGVGGVSKVYGEDDLGGFVAQAKLIYSFKTR